MSYKLARRAEGGMSALTLSRSINYKAVRVEIIFFVAVVFAVLAAFVVPAAAIFAVLTFFIFLPRSKSWTMTLSAVTVIALFVWLNVDKVPMNDWGWYTIHYKWLQTMPLSDYLGNTFYGMKIRQTEPVYHSISFVLSRITGGSIPALAAAITIIIYGGVSLGVAQLVRARIENNFEACLVVWVPLAIGITFTLTAQLVRQELAGAVAFLGFSLLYAGKKVVPWVFIVIALLSHNSSFFPILCVLFSIAMLARMRFGFACLILLSVLGALIGISFLLSPGGENYYLSQQDDGRVSWLVIGFDAFLVLVLGVIGLRSECFRDLSEKLIASAVCYASFIAAVSPAPLLFLRMYFYFDFIRTGLLVVLVIVLLKLRGSMIFGVLLLLAAFVYIELRILSSPFYFRGGLVAHLFRPFALFQ